MPKRSSKKKSRDLNSLAAAIVAEATAEPTGERQNKAEQEQAGVDDDGKNPAAVALGRLGGLKGGKARAKKLSKSRRSAIAKKAAKARWKGK